MKKRWIVLVVVTLGITLSPMRSGAQGPQGSGAGEAARAAAPSRNPISWLKKKQLMANETLDANGNESAKLTSRLQTQGVLPANADLKRTCETFGDLGECVATLHAGHNLGLDFDCLKSKVTGVQAGNNVSSCISTTDGKPMGLRNAIHVLQPGKDAKTETNQAEKQSRDDLTEGSS